MIVLAYIDMEENRDGAARGDPRLSATSGSRSELASSAETKQQRRVTAGVGAIRNGAAISELPNNRSVIETGSSQGKQL